MNSDFIELQRIGFFDTFQIENDPTKDYIQAKIGYTTKRGVEKVFSFFARKNAGNNLHLENLFGPGYGVFLMTILFCMAYSHGYKEVTLTAATQNHTIIKQDALERFYKIFGFEDQSMSYGQGCMGALVTTELCQKICAMTLKIVHEKSLFQENGKIAHIKPTSKLQKLEDSGDEIFLAW